MTIENQTGTDTTPVAEKIGLDGFPLPAGVATIGALNLRPRLLSPESDRALTLLSKVNLPPLQKPYDYPHISYAVRFSFTDRIYAGKPVGSKIIYRWLETQFKGMISRGQATEQDMLEVLTVVEQQSQETVKNTIKKVIQNRLGMDTLSEMEEELDAKADASTNVFYADERGFYIEAYQLKAGLKLAASVLGYTRALSGNRARVGMKDILQHLVHVFPQRIYLAKFDRALPPDSTDALLGALPSDPTKPLDAVDSGIWHVGPAFVPPVHVSAGSVTDRQGQRPIIKRKQYFGSTDYAPLTISFLLKVAKCQEFFTKERLDAMLAIWQDNGVGSDRSQGAGTFTLACEAIEVENVGPDPKPAKAEGEEGEEDGDSAATAAAKPRRGRPRSAK